MFHLFLRHAESLHSAYRFFPRGESARFPVSSCEDCAQVRLAEYKFD